MIKNKKEYLELYRKKNRQKFVQYQARYRKKLRLEILEYYGGRCRCCGESEEKFLSFDHINNNGAEHRRKVNYGSISWWLKKEGFPKDFQILCHNCNGAKGYYGICPHQE